MHQAGAAVDKGLTFLKLEFLHILCSHEHHVVLNLPFPVEHEEKEQVKLCFIKPLRRRSVTFLTIMSKLASPEVGLSRRA